MNSEQLTITSSFLPGSSEQLFMIGRTSFPSEGWLGFLEALG